MATITAAMVKDLRETTGVGMMDCKTALNETKGDLEAAVDWLRTKGLAKAAKKAGRVAVEGLVAVAGSGERAAEGEDDRARPWGHVREVTGGAEETHRRKTDEFRVV